MPMPCRPSGNISVCRAMWIRGCCLAPPRHPARVSTRGLKAREAGAHIPTRPRILPGTPERDARCSLKPAKRVNELIGGAG